MKTFAIKLKRERLAAALIIFFFFLNALDASAQDKLIFALDIIRHGDRTPTVDLPGMDSSVWTNGLGELTDAGKRQEFALGEKKGRFYATNGLWSEVPSPSNMLVFSTSLDRTRMSAEEFLKGFFAGAPSAPKIPIQTNVPINATDVMSTDELLIPTHRPDYDRLLQLAVFHTPDWRFTNAALQPEFARWSQLTHTKIRTPHDLLKPGDTIFIRRQHGFPLPEGLNSGDAQAIIDAGRWAQVYEYEGKAGRITGKETVKAVANFISNAGDAAGNGSAHPVRYVLFSAHDSTLLSVLSALGSPLTGTNIPPYAASLHFGLWQKDGTNFEVRVIYNDGADHDIFPPHASHAWSLENLRDADLALPGK